jgi:hypothetical protein
MAKARPDQTIAICGGLLNEVLDHEPDRPESLNWLGSLILSGLANLRGGCDVVQGWIDREPTAAETLTHAIRWSFMLPEYREASQATVTRVENGIEVLRSSSALGELIAGQLLNYSNAALGNEALGFPWDLPGPTDAELEELEAAIAEDGPALRRWLDPELGEWSGSDPDDIDGMSDGTWWNNA